jgi:hypothetical protein
VLKGAWRTILLLLLLLLLLWSLAACWCGVLGGWL